MNILLSVLSKAGLLAIPGLLILVALLFWDKDRPWARRSLILSILLILLMSVWVIVATIDEKNSFLERWPGKYDISLSPPPQGLHRWGGIYEDGRPVERIEAELLLNEKEEPEKTITVVGLKIEDRELQAENDPDDSDRMLIKMNEHIQGYIPYRTLEEDVRKFISSATHPLPYAVAVTEEIRELDKEVGVDPESAVKEEFGGFKMEVREWNFDPQKPGATVFIYSKDARGQEIRGQETLVTRGEPFSTDDIVVALLYIDLKKKDSRQARFVLLKYR